MSTLDAPFDGKSSRDAHLIPPLPNNFVSYFSFNVTLTALIEWERPLHENK
jgi:hypothetical protein